MTTQDVINALHELGFKLYPIKDHGFRFDFEGLPMLCERNDYDKETVSFHVPFIFDITPENEEAVYKAMLKLTGKLMFVQPNIMHDDEVWLTYQHYFGDREVDNITIEHMIRTLAGATEEFHNLINEDE